MKTHCLFYKTKENKIDKIYLKEEKLFSFNEDKQSLEEYLVQELKLSKKGLRRIHYLEDLEYGQEKYDVYAIDISKLKTQYFTESLGLEEKGSFILSRTKDVLLIGTFYKLLVYLGFNSGK